MTQMCRRVDVDGLFSCNLYLSIYSLSRNNLLGTETKDNSRPTGGASAMRKELVAGYPTHAEI